ncbi:MAG TPA: hypothetical protein VLH79_14385 [Chthonomonadales bacterium]|nr:hypothetical protein [Chthonomonadales bacterium]
MLKMTLALAAAGVFLAGAVHARPKEAGRVTVVKVCPMKGSKVTNLSGPTSTVGRFRVHFCCPGCKPSFDRLSVAQKQSRIAQALQRQRGGKRG